MAIYRPRPSRLPFVIGALVVGLLGGLATGAALVGGRPASVEDAATRVRGSLDGAASLLEIASLEYAEAVQAGTVVNPVEYQGSLDALTQSRARYEEAQGALVTLDPPRAAAIAAAYARLETLMRQPAPIEEMQPDLGALEGLLRSEPGAEASP